MKTALLAILLFCILIFPHELGHFIVAKLCKVQVNEFALGMGPAIFKKQKGETLYALRAIPVGGYCSMEGENEESENPRAFNNKTGWQKILVLVAGSAMNVLICILVMGIMSAVVGSTTTTIGAVEKGAPAYVADVRAEDEIIEVNGQKVHQWTDVSSIITKSFDKDDIKPIELTVLRDSKEYSLSVTPEYSKKEERPIIGIESKLDHNLGRSAVVGFTSTWSMTKQIFKSLGMLISGEVSAKDLSGPVGIVTVVGKTSSYGTWYFFYLVAFISINLAIVNMLPLPALDGGRILFVIIRKITGKMISDDLEGKIHAIGLILLLLLMVYVTWNDIGRLF